MNKKAPIYRTDIVSRKLFLKNELFRVVKTNSGVYFDKNQNIQGRGVYIHQDLMSILIAQKRNLLSNGLRKKVNDEIYLQLIQELSKKEGKWYG